MFKVGDRVRIKTEEELRAMGYEWEDDGDLGNDDPFGCLDPSLSKWLGTTATVTGSNTDLIDLQLDGSPSRESLGWFAHQLVALDTPKSSDLTKVAVKHDSNKIPLELLPPEALVEIAKVLAFGATTKGYGRWNWAQGFAWSRLAGAALRHLFAWLGGENKDPESNLSHLAHLGCCVLFLLTHELKGLGDDDRFKYPK
jgi:hypothetical protein